MDDGSVEAPTLSARYTVLHGRRRTPEEHVSDPNFARFLRAGTALCTTPYITYLCDDDEFSPHWLSDACRLLEQHEVIVGDVITSDGSAIHSLAAGNFCVGNFALRRSLANWPETKSVSPENELRKWLIIAGVPITKVEVPALLARKHAFNLSRYVDASNDLGEFRSGAEEFYKRESVE